MDIGVFTRTYSEQMDWNWIGEKLSELKLTQFAENAYTFILRWFDIKSSIKTVKINEELYESSTACILENGVFGFRTADDKGALLNYDIAKTGDI